MSLLMDALKKAELAKRQGSGGGTADATGQGSGLTLEPLPARAVEASASSAATPEKFPDLPSHLEKLDAQAPVAPPRQPAPTDEPHGGSAAFASSAQPARPTRPSAFDPRPLPPPLAPAHRSATTSAGATAEVPTGKPSSAAPTASEPAHGSAAQASAQNLFAAKQPGKTPPRKTFAIAIGALTVLGVAGIGVYFWWQLQPKSNLVAFRPAPASSVPPVPAATVAPAGDTLAPAAQQDDGDDEQEDEKPVAAPPVSPPPVAPPRAPAALLADADAPVRVSRTPLRVNPQIMLAYDAFGRGDLATAQLGYQRVLSAEPHNTDALHGLAAIALRQGRPDQAEMFYQRLLDADPQDSVALAATINAKSPTDPTGAESRLKTLATTQPELSAPHFALGNLYARQARWAEAQQAYFRAYAAESDNPDILYNLAISLEHLRQPKLASKYYDLALAAAQVRPSGFDKAQAAARLRALQP